MNIKKKLLLGLLAVLMPVPALTVFSKAVRSRTSDAATQEIYHRQFEKSLGWK